MKKRKLTIKSHRGNGERAVLLVNSNTAHTQLIIMFITSANTFPIIIMVDEAISPGPQEWYCMRKLIKKQTLQMKATLEKNNNFRIPQLGVKLHYFAHY